MLLCHPAAQAQITFNTELTDEAMERLEEMEAVDGESLYEVLSEHLRLSYEGEEPVEARLVVFLTTSDGDLRGSLSSEPFELEPGTEMRGQAVPEEEFLSLIGESTFTYGTGSFMVSLDPVSASDIAFEFEDAWREGQTWSPEYARAWAQAFSNGIQGANVKGTHGGIGLALVPVIGRYIAENATAIQVQYVAAMNQNADW